MGKVFFNCFVMQNKCLINQKHIKLSPSTNNMRESNELASAGMQLQPHTHSSKEPVVLGLKRWTVTGGMRGKIEQEMQGERHRVRRRGL